MNDQEFRRHLIQVRKHPPPEESVYALRELYEDEWQQLVRSAVEADRGRIVLTKCVHILATVFPESEFELLLSLLRSQYAMVRATCCYYLSFLPTEKVQEPLIERALHDRYPMVRLHAIQALGDCGDMRALPALHKIQQYDKVRCHGYDLSLEAGGAIDFILEQEAKKQDGTT